MERSRLVARLGSRPNERGFTYLWVLVAIALMGLGLAAVSEVWVTSARRQKLVEFEWIGAQFARAIGSYYQSSPGAAKAYPASLQELIDDRRYVTTRRHLRTIYANPFTGKQDWDLVVAADGRLRGVRVTAPSDEGGAVREFVYEPGGANR
jgi:type II secretory pathway pseudopilin PulG